MTLGDAMKYIELITGTGKATEEDKIEMTPEQERAMFKSMNSKR